MLSILWFALQAAFLFAKCLCSILWEGIKTVFTSRKKTVVLFCGVGVLLGLHLLTTNLHIAFSLSAEWWKTYLFAYVFLLNGGIVRRIKHYLLKKKYKKIFESIKYQVYIHK